MPELTWTELLVRYNVEGDQVALHVDPSGDTTLHGILTLRGFNSDNCAIKFCQFQRDLSLPLGTMVLEPLGVPDA